MNVKNKHIVFFLIVLLLTLIIAALLLANKEITKKEVKAIKYIGPEKVLSPNENTTWQNDYEYVLDEENSIITLNKYIGTQTELTVPSKAVIQGKEYTVALRKNNADTDGIWYEDITSLSFEQGIKLPEDCSYMFHNCSDLTNLDLSNFDTSNVTNMSAMFFNCSSLTSLDLNNFNTSNVTNMQRMFLYCSRLSNLNLGNFKTNNVTDMSAMFSGCRSLTNLNVSSFNTSNVTDMNSMFSGCRSLTSLNLSNFKTNNVTDMNSMFSNCISLTNLNISSFNTSKVTNMTYMFWNCSSLTSLNVSSFNTDNVQYMHSMFNNCSSLTSLNVSSFNTSNVIGMSSMFSSCSNLTSLDVSNFNTSSVTDMGNMFSSCSNLASLNLSNFRTSNVTDMHNMFKNCSSLTSLDVSNFTTNSVTDMAGMFSDCTMLTNLNVSNFDTSNVTRMDYMFSSCKSLTDLDVTKFYTNNVTNMSYMFYGCSNLTNLDVSSFDTKNVTDMSRMFASCNSLINLNISNFNTGNVTNMSAMFSSCKNLTSLNMSGFNTSSVKDMSLMFNGCNNLINLDLSNFNTSNATNMYAMFSGCKNLTSLNISSFDMGNITQVGSMFSGCNKLIFIETPINVPTGIDISLNGNYYMLNEEKVYGDTTVNKLPKGLTKSTSLAKLTNRVTGVELDKNQIGVDIKDMDKSLLATITPAKATDPRVSWISSNEEIVRVEDGKIIPVKTGTAEVTAKTYDGGYTASANITVTKTLTGIKVTTEPKKTSYIKGENFDRAEMQVIAIYNDESTEEITNYTVIDGENLQVGKESVTIRYTENGITKEISQMITVTNNVTQIRIKEGTVPVKAIKGIDLDLSNAKIIVTRENGETEEKEVTLDMISGYDRETVGEQEVTVTCEEKTTTFIVTVTDIETIVVIVNTNLEEKEEGENTYLEKIGPKTEIGEIEEKILQTNGTIKVYKGETEITNTSQKLGTGMRIEIEKEGNQKQEYTVIVTGDCTGDGEADIKDMVRINNYRLYGTTTNFGAIYQKAADINKDGKLDIKDMVRINNYRLYGTKL